MIFFLLSFLTSIAGAVSGIGGGILLKPVLDLTSSLDVAQVNFFSNCTVLGMAATTMLRRRSQLKGSIDLTTAALALGSVAGGLAGTQLFTQARAFLPSEGVKTVQSAILAVLCSAIIIYMANKEKIRRFNMKSRLAITLTGFVLGVVSAFLGIGGGLVNMIVLTFLFSMESKAASLASIFIICCSQSAGLALNVFTGIPAVGAVELACIICGGIAGGFVGGSLAKKASSTQTDRAFICVTGSVILLSVTNFFMNI